jgi:hypothetical protein
MTDLTVEPLIPGALWLLLAVLGAGVMTWYAMRRPASVSPRRWIAVISLMSGALLLTLGLLLNPTWSRELPPPAGKPVLSVLVDTSGSMSTPDVSGGATRFASAAALANDITSKLSDRFDVRVTGFDQSSRLVDPASLTAATPVGASTDLSSAINGALTEDHPQGQAVVLLSDGIDNAGGGTSPILAAVRTAKSMAAPIYTRTFGGDMKSFDLGVELRSPQDMAVIGQNVPINARITHVGISTGKAVVTLWKDGKEIARREPLLDPNVASDVTFQVQNDKVGIYPYEIRVEPLPGETSLANNTAAFVLRVVDEPMRVLLLEGKPYWDSKFFTRTLMSDPAVALDCIVRISDSRLLHRTLSHQPSTATTKPGEDPPPAERVETWKIDSDAAAVLASPDRLRGYQVIVIGRDADPFLTDTAVTNLQTWVSQQGGCLLCYRGSPTSTVNQKLAKLLPVRWAASSPTRFRVALTPAGKDLNWFSVASPSVDSLPTLPSLAASSSIESSKPLAVVLAQSVGDSGAPAPAVIYQAYGSGRVVVVEGSGMWRWAFLAPAYQDQDQTYAGLWHSMMRWLTNSQGLTPGQMFSLRADKVRFSTDEPAMATLLARQDISRDKLPQVQLTADGSKDAKSFSAFPLGDEAGVYRINFGPLAEGRYHAKLSLASTHDSANEIVFDVRKYDQEMLDLQARPDLMARIATDSGGAVLLDNGPDEIAREFKEHMAAVMPPRIERTVAWDRWWVLLIVLCLWSVSWTVRRAGGLV